MFISDQGCLLRKALSGENHFLLVLFLKEHGLKYALARKAGGKSIAVFVPDLFQTGEYVLEQKDPSRPAFLKDFSLGQAFKEIGRNYQTLKVASSIARFYEQNLLHMEHFPEAWDLLQKSFLTLTTKPRPEVTLLKMCFLFARSEGYPVVAQWLNQQSPSDKAAIAYVLQQPVEETNSEPAIVYSWINGLNQFFARDTDLLPIGQ